MKEKIMEIIRGACALEENITENSELRLLSLDSLSFVGAVVAIEDEFDIEFDIDELVTDKFGTVLDVINAVKEKIHERQ